MEHVMTLGTHIEISWGQKKLSIDDLSSLKGDTLFVAW